MGFSYNYLGLCCDFCSNAGPKGNVRKIACPYGWCQAWACCTDCKAKKRHLQCSCGDGLHKDICKKLTQEDNKKKQEKQYLLNQGYYLRVAALEHGDIVKVVFQNNNGNEKACFMTSKNYQKMPLGKIAKLEDFEIISMAKNTALHNLELEIEN